MLGFVGLLVSVFVSRFVGEKANKKLDPEKRLQLMDLFSKDRVLYFGILIAIIVLYFAVLKFELLDASASMILYIVAFFAYMAITTALAYKKLKVNDFPQDYIRSYLTSTLIRVIGLVVFFALIEI